MSNIQVSIFVLGLTGFSFSILLAFLSKKLKVKENPRVEKVLDTLPGLNCGACGFSGCKPFAEAVIEKNEIFSGCLPGGSNVNEKIAEILGAAKRPVTHKQVVVCRCGAEIGEKKSSSLYQGPQTCKAVQITGGIIDCAYGCFGLGDCLEVCPTKALTIKNKKIYIDNKKCIGCGKCIKACPRNLFEMVTLKKDTGIYYIACNNKEKAPGVRKTCGKGCIGCGICAKIADSPYYLKENLSYIDYTKTNCKDSLEEGKNKCPTKCIVLNAD